MPHTTASDGPLLDVRSVAKAYGGNAALRGVDLAVAAGEITALLGRNGAGKSTLVSIVAGLREPDAGTVTVAGRPVRGARARGRNARRDAEGGGPSAVGYAGQDTAVYPNVTVRDNLRLFGRLSGLRGAPLRDAVAGTAERLELAGLLDRKPRDLSGGERRRAHIAAAVVHRPALLLLDEPTLGADVVTRARLLEVVRKLAAEGTAVLYTTHYLQEVADLDARVVVLDDGRVLAEGGVAELSARHGLTAVEVAFEGAAADGPPDLGIPGTTAVEGTGVLRIPCADTAAAIADVATRAGALGARITGVEVIEPSLESVFLTLTGRRYDEEAG
ncbi:MULTISPECIES: ABC transporter ATP-binding protein [Actinomadura]|uniref:ATP-binding cassette domain-containing protein n=1 Tax=Actinomadura yumaensis TaxID=111807 RepID=A0ABW2CFS0_9ACTN|nr:ABC transporter ATP-binding protein [Actinomadura sp. J1-007]